MKPFWRKAKSEPRRVVWTIEARLHEDAPGETWGASSQADHPEWLSLELPPVPLGRMAVVRVRRDAY